jgi:uncharacterized membrane protein YcaP (DUF421 family)
MTGDARESELIPEPPKLERRWDGAPKALALVAALAALPITVLAKNEIEPQARGSVLHVAISFVVLTVAFRVIGKRELGRLSPFELVTLKLIPEILSNSVQGQGSLVSSLAGLCTILLMVVGTSLLSQRFPRVKEVLQSPPTLLVADGQLLHGAMNRERISPDELTCEMRKQDVKDLSEIRFAVLESDGKITFVAKTPREGTSSDSDD